MPRGGKRAGAGRKKGTPNSRVFALEGEEAAATERPLTPGDRQTRMRKQVAVCAAAGMTPEEIATVVRIPLPKLKVVFEHELSNGRTLIRAEQLMNLDAASAEGKVAAAKALLQATDGAERKPAQRVGAESIDDKVRKRALRLLNGGKGQ